MTACLFGAWPAEGDPATGIRRGTGTEWVRQEVMESEAGSRFYRRRDTLVALSNTLEPDKRA